jgi:hypothetical protein
MTDKPRPWRRLARVAVLIISLAALKNMSLRDVCASGEHCGRSDNGVSSPPEVGGTMNVVHVFFVFKIRKGCCVMCTCQSASQTSIGNDQTTYRHLEVRWSLMKVVHVSLFSK